MGYQDKFFDNKLGVEIFGAYSNSVFVNDRDHHIVRNRVTIGKFNRAKYYNLGGNLTYNFYDNFIFIFFLFIIIHFFILSNYYYNFH